jgi:protein phosphatase
MSSSQAKSATDVIWGAATNRGGRPANQDRFSTAHRPGQHTLVVCDGLGGHRGGEVAAEFGVRRFLEKTRVQGAGSRLRALAAEISREIIELGRARPALEGLGTTLAAVIIEDEEATFAAVGDSRIYLLRRGCLGLLAEPHDLASILMREGVLSEDEFRSSPLRGRVTSYLGLPDPEVTAGAFRTRPGDRLALVTDGVLEGGEKRLRRILSGSCPDQAATELVHEIETEDNATALVAFINTREGSCSVS